MRTLFENKKNLKTRKKRVPGSRREKLMDVEKLLDEDLDGEGEGRKFSE